MHLKDFDCKFDFDWETHSTSVLIENEAKYYTTRKGVIYDT